jgi:DNA repair protein SbcD/Mre11
MRILHTADWHLGHTLRDQDRQFEHGAFLDWLLTLIGDQQVDALLVCGDVFDSSNPPATAQAAWYGFLARAHAQHPTLDVVAIGGNHDSAARLEAPSPVLQALNVHTVGQLPRCEDGSADVDRLLVPLTDRDGQVAARVAAVPYLRPADLPAPEDPDADRLVEGARQRYCEILAGARERMNDGEALIATGHCYMVGSRLSELSERRIFGGNLHALPVDIYPDDVAYVALGHLHRVQTVGGHEHVRYAGSPIPLALDEQPYPHQVLLVDVEDGEVAQVHEARVPRAVEILRLPADGPAPLSEVLPLLEGLEDLAEDAPRDTRPYLEVRVLLPAPESTLRQQVDEALDGKAPRLLKLTPEYTGDGLALGDHESSRELDDLSEEEVFVRCYQREHESAVPEDLMQAFREVLAAVQQGGAS